MQSLARITQLSRWFIILIACWLVSCSLNDTPALRVGANIWPGYEPLSLARHFGYYDADRIKLVELPSAVDVIRAYRNGAIDVAALTADEALTVAATEPGQHRIFLVADYSNGADAILAQPEFPTMSQLRGRRIGAEGNALGALILTRALALSGMSSSDVQFVPLSLGEHEAAFLARQVDAVVTFDPRRTRLLAQGAKEVFSSAQIPGEIVDVLIARKSLLQARSHHVEHLLVGWFRALALLQAEPAKAASFAARHERVTAEEFLLSLRGIRFVDAVENQRLLQGALRAPLDALVKTMMARELLESVPDTATLLDGSWVSEVATARALQ